VDRKVELRGVQDQLLFPPFHRFAAPAGDGVLIDAFRLVGHDEVFVYAGHLAVALAAGTGADGIVEAEHVFARLFEHDAVRF